MENVYILSVTLTGRKFRQDWCMLSKPDCGFNRIERPVTARLEVERGGSQCICLNHLLVDPIWHSYLHMVYIAQTVYDLHTLTRPGEENRSGLYTFSYCAAACTYLAAVSPLLSGDILPS